MRRREGQSPHFHYPMFLLIILFLIIWDNFYSKDLGPQVHSKHELGYLKDDSNVNFLWAGEGISIAIDKYTALD